MTPPESRRLFVECPACGLAGGPIPGCPICGGTGFEPLRETLADLRGARREARAAAGRAEYDRLMSPGARLGRAARGLLGRLGWAR